MSNNKNNNNDTELSDSSNIAKTEKETSQDVKPHIIRRNIEDYLADRALKRRLTDIFDDDFLMD